ncbi:hypothetical protein P3514_20010, partial [Vibrio parahaemolyticus]|nr:hypothetical protein [Vibrio parahaemolyticus]
RGCNPAYSKSIHTWLRFGEIMRGSLRAERVFSNADLLSVWCVEQTGNVAIFEALGFKVAERVESDIFELADSSNLKAIEVRLERQTAV